MRCIADVTDGKLTAVYGVSSVNFLVAFYDVHGTKVPFFSLRQTLNTIQNFIIKVIIIYTHLYR
jgi:hypothetical protein